MNEPIVATFSIVGYDPLTKEWGIAVQSKFLAVGAICPYAQAGVGAIATQSYANTSFGPRGLKLLSEGKSAQEVVDILVNSDPRRSKRQLGIVDSQGNAATFTGDECHDWAGGITGSNFAAQGNILVSDKTVEAMAEVFFRYGRMPSRKTFRIFRCGAAGRWRFKRTAICRLTYCARRRWIWRL